MSQQPICPSFIDGHLFRNPPTLAKREEIAERKTCDRLVARKVSSANMHFIQI